MIARQQPNRSPRICWSDDTVYPIPDGYTIEATLETVQRENATWDYWLIVTFTAPPDAPPAEYTAQLYFPKKLAQDAQPGEPTYFTYNITHPEIGALGFIAKNGTPFIPFYARPKPRPHQGPVIPKPA
jgi:hypothetical protein